MKSKLGWFFAAYFLVLSSSGFAAVTQKEVSAAKEELRNASKERARAELEVKDVETQIENLKKATRPTSEQQSCKGCAKVAREFCNKPKSDFKSPDDKLKSYGGDGIAFDEDHPCVTGSCKVAATPDGEGKDSVCYRIYASKGQSCFNALTADRQSDILNCWAVKNVIDAESLKTETLEPAKKKVAELKLAEESKKAEVASLENDCVDCAIREAVEKRQALMAALGVGANGMPQQREPGTFEKTMMGISVIGGLVGNIGLGVMNGVLSYNAHQNYLDTYSQQAARAAEMGIVMPAPDAYAGYGGFGGYGMYTGAGGGNPLLYGLYGALGGLSGLGNGGGLYIGANLGYGGNPYGMYGPSSLYYPQGYPFNPYPGMMTGLYPGMYGNTMMAPYPIYNGSIMGGYPYNMMGNGMGNGLGAGIFIGGGLGGGMPGMGGMGAPSIFGGGMSPFWGNPFGMQSSYPIYPPGMMGGMMPGMGGLGGLGGIYIGGGLGGMPGMGGLGGMMPGMGGMMPGMGGMCMDCGPGGIFGPGGMMPGMGGPGGLGGIYIGGGLGGMPGMGGMMPGMGGMMPGMGGMMPGMGGMMPGGGGGFIWPSPYPPTGSVIVPGMAGGNGMSCYWGNCGGGGGGGIFGPPYMNGFPGMPGGVWGSGGMPGMVGGGGGMPPYYGMGNMGNNWMYGPGMMNSWQQSQQFYQQQWAQYQAQMQMMQQRNQYYTSEMQGLQNMQRDLYMRYQQLQVAMMTGGVVPGMSMGGGISFGGSVGVGGGMPPTGSVMPAGGCPAGTTASGNYMVGSPSFCVSTSGGTGLPTTGTTNPGSGF